MAAKFFTKWTDAILHQFSTHRDFWCTRGIQMLRALEVGFTQTSGKAIGLQFDCLHDTKMGPTEHLCTCQCRLQQAIRHLEKASGYPSPPCINLQLAIRGLDKARYQHAMDANITADNKITSIKGLIVKCLAFNESQGQWGG